MNKAVFLDRDGVVNKELGRYCESVDEFEILEGLGDAIKILKDSGYKVIIISNQGGIAKGIYTEADVVALHCQDLQFADLRLGFATRNSLHHKDAHVEPDERTLAATEVDVNFLLLVFLDCGAFEDVCF